MTEHFSFDVFSSTMSMPRWWCGCTKPFRQEQLLRYAADFKTETGKTLGVFAGGGTGYWQICEARPRCARMHKAEPYATLRLLTLTNCRTPRGLHLRLTK
jgi:hypothetical protein